MHSGNDSDEHAGNMCGDPDYQNVTVLQIGPAWLKLLQVTAPVLTVAGILANILTMAAVCMPRMRSNVNNILIGNLAAAEFMYVCIVCLTQSVIYNTQPITGMQPWVTTACSFVAPFRFNLSGTMLFLLSAIAFYRYINIVCANKHNILSSRKGTLVVICISWFGPLAFVLPPTFKIWGSFTYEISTLTCYFSRSSDASNRITIVTLGFVIPVCFILVCYTKIGLVALKSHNRMKVFRMSTRTLRKFTVHRDSLRLAAMMASLFFCFLFTCLPYMIVNIVDSQTRYPKHHIWTNLLAWCMHSSNPIIYTVMSKNFQNAYRDIITCDFKGRKRSMSCVNDAMSGSGRNSRDQLSIQE